MNTFENITENGAFTPKEQMTMDKNGINHDHTVPAKGAVNYDHSAPKGAV